MTEKSVAETIIQAERTLLDPAVRSDPVALDRWLDPDFTEIGQSGRLWTRPEILDDLLTTDQSNYGSAELYETTVLKLAEGCYLSTYVVHIEDRRSRRSSIWRVRNGALRLVFNHGTPLGQND